MRVITRLIIIVRITSIRSRNKAYRHGYSITTTLLLQVSYSSSKKTAQEQKFRFRTPDFSDAEDPRSKLDNRVGVSRYLQLFFLGPRVGPRLAPEKKVYRRRGA